MRFKQLTLLILILSLALSMAFAQSRADQDIPAKGQSLPAPFASFSPQRDGNLVSSTMIFEEDFDPAPGSWFIGNGWYIGMDEVNGAISGMNSAHTDNPYESYANYELISPQITLPAATEMGTRYELRLWHWWEVESSYDYVYIDVLISGQLQSTLMTQTGSQAWTENALDLTAYAGQTIQLRFRLTSDGTNSYSGFGIDDVQIWKNIYEYQPEMDLLSLNAQNFPFIYSTLSVAMEGENLSELDETNFQVYENDVLQTNFFSVTPPSTGAGSRLVDIAFQMDNSGSMSSSISAISANVTAFINNLSGSGVDSALGLCRYGQSANGGYPILEDNGVLTTNLDYFRDSVWNRNVIDGGNEPGYNALTQSLAGFNWRPGSQKVLIIITDETPDQGGSTLQQAIDAATANGAIVFALTYSYYYSTFTPITDATGGAVYDINSSFDDILDHISQIIVSNYIISYRSSNPYYDGTLRNLRYVMNYGNVTAEEVGSYFPGQAPLIVRSPNTMIYDNQAQLDNQDLPIEVIITDTYAPFTSNATLYYRNFNQSMYSPLAMQNVSGDLWAATIPAGAVQTPGIAYYFSASDGQSTSTLPSSEPANSPFTVAVLPNLPPIVTHFPQVQINYYSPLSVSATIFDETEYVNDVVLAYRSYGQLSYTQVPMTAMDNDVYSAQIPGEIVGSTGVEYFIRAWDNFGLVGASGYADSPHYVAALLDGTVIPGGQITDLWWTPQNSPYHVSSDVFVDPNSTLHIAPGSTLIFSPGTGLEVQGGLVATGAQFLAQNTYMGWDGIFINNAVGPITIQNCSIQHAVVGVTFSNSNGDMFNNTISKDMENNVFTGEAGLSIQGLSSPNIDGLNVHNYTPAILIQNINTTGSNPSLQNVYMHSHHNADRTGGTGLKVEGNVSLSLEEIEIAEYDNGIDWEGSMGTDVRTTAMLTSIIVRNTADAGRNPSQAMNIRNVSTLQGTDIDISGYPQGIQIDNPELANAANALLTNIRVRNSSSSSRTDDYGIKIGAKVALALEDAEIEDYTFGIDVEGAPQTLGQNSALLTNIRVRNSTSTSRVNAYGIKMANVNPIMTDDTEIDGFAYGLWIDNQTLAGTANALLTNIRVRNSSSTSRTEDYGIKIMSNVALELSNVEIDDYGTGLALMAGNDTGGINRNSVLLTNIRVRNSTSTSRIAGHGIKISNHLNVTANETEIEGYPFGMDIDNQTLAGTANALLTNIRVRNSASPSRTEGIGLRMIGAIAAEIDSTEIWDFATGLYYEGNGLPFRTTPLLTNIRVRNSSSSSRTEAQGIVLKNLADIDINKCIVYPDLAQQRSENALGAGIVADAVANLSVLQSNIWGYQNGMRLVNGSHADFTRSVIWKNTAEELTVPIQLDASTVNASFSNISSPGGVFTGTGNLDLEPKFADPLEGNFYLKPRSKLHNPDPALVIGALPYDFYALADTLSNTFQPGWNMMGVPYLLAPGQNSPATVFGNYLQPFYVHPYYTSILQLNPNAMPDSLGHVVFSLAPAYSVPTHIRAGVGYWVRNPNPHPVDVEVYGLMDDDEYVMETPGVDSPFEGFFMLANPYDRPIRLNDGIELEGTVTPFVRIYDHENNALPALNLNEGAEIPAWASFIIKTGSATDKIHFEYPSARAETTNQPQLANSGLSTSVPSKPDWELHLNAHSNEHSAVVVMGVAEAGRDTYDPMDVPTVPFRPYNAMELKVNNQDWDTWAGNYSRDIRSNRHSSYTWHLTLNVQDLLVDGQFSGAVRLSMNSPYKLPVEFSYRIVDVRSGSSADLISDIFTLPLSIDLNDPAQGGSPHLIPLMVVVEKPAGSNPELSAISTGNYPNPFNPSTTITYSIPSDGFVSVDIYNIRGQLVRQLLSTEQSKGSHSVVWNGKDNNDRECSSGFYFYRVSAGEQSLTRKILMLK